MGAYPVIIAWVSHDRFEEGVDGIERQGGGPTAATLQDANQYLRGLGIQPLHQISRLSSAGTYIGQIQEAEKKAEEGNFPGTRYGVEDARQAAQSAGIPFNEVRAGRALERAMEVVIERAERDNTARGVLGVLAVGMLKMDYEEAVKLGVHFDRVRAARIIAQGELRILARIADGSYPTYLLRKLGKDGLEATISDARKYSRVCHTRPDPKVIERARASFREASRGA